MGDLCYNGHNVCSFVGWILLVANFGNRMWIWLEVVGFGCLIYLQIFFASCGLCPVAKEISDAFRQNDEKHFVVLCIAFSWF